MYTPTKYSQHLNGLPEDIGSVNIALRYIWYLHFRISLVKKSQCVDRIPIGKCLCLQKVFHFFLFGELMKYLIFEEN